MGNTIAVLVMNSILLGVGLAMDAFTVSLANGLNEPKMRANRMCLIAGIFAVFQGLMPLIGWFCVREVLQYFSAFSKLIPWIALILLGFIGTKMLIEGIKSKSDDYTVEKLGFAALIVQGIATSIDALSVGFTIADYSLLSALTSAVIIAVVTFILCFIGLVLGKRFGTKFAGKATIFGGIILVGIGIEIFITGII